MAAVPELKASDLDPNFHTYDLTLTDRELEDFLSFMEHQGGGVAACDAMPPQLPVVAADFPGLQLQPHSGSPSTSEGSESIGAQQRACGAWRAAFPASACGGDGAPHAPGASTGSLSSGLAPPCSATSNDTSNQPGDDGQAPPDQRCPPVLAGADACGVAEPEAPEAMDLEIKEEPTAGEAAAQPPSALQPPSNAPGTARGVAVSLPFAVQPAAVSLQAMAPAGVALQWANGAGVQQQLQPVVFIQAPAAAAATASAAAPTRTVAQRQQQPRAAGGRSGGRGGAEAAGRGVAGSGASATSGRSAPLRSASNDAAASSSGFAGKGQVSHSTVEKQRRDRLNSLIDELSDIVPPADPKYGCDAASVRRPKHVVLADTINMLKAMQTKLQIEEAELCTLKQQAAAVAVIAAQQQTQRAHHPQQQQEPGAPVAMAEGAPAPSTASPRDDAGAGAGAGADRLPALPLPPDGGVCATGVLVEQGDGCLLVKVNCRDRKGLLADLVSALKAFPIVISTAAITTTKDGAVHDVFEVRIEDDSVTAEDIQCAVHLALFSAERARSKRLRATGQ